MRDSVLELWLRLLALHLPEPSNLDPQAVHQVTRQIRDGWLLASKGFFNECVPSDLEGAVSTNEGRSVVQAAIQSLKAALEHQPTTISKDALNLLGFESGQWAEDFETRRLIEVADAFLELLDGKISDTARSTDRMPGCR